MARPKGDWLPYEDVKVWVSRLRLSNYKEWLRYVSNHKLPPRIPKNPQVTYGDEYVSDPDFLGHTEYLPYEQAELYVKRLKLKSYTNWLRWYDEHQPTRIPKYPDQIAGYRDNWVSWGTFLGTGTVSVLKQRYRPYLEAVKFTHTLNITKKMEWFEFAVSGNKPVDIPSNPELIYKDDWNGWTEWLGKTTSDRVDVKLINVSVLYVKHEACNPANVLTIDVEHAGASNIKLNSGDRVVKIYDYCSELSNEVLSVIAANTTPWYDVSNQYLVANIHSLLYDFDRILQEHTNMSHDHDT